jgi:hypothetical protein
MNLLYTKYLKGNCDNKVILITPYYGGGTAIINDKEVLFKGRWSHPEPGHGVSVPNNYYQNNTGIFLLNKNQPTKLFPYLKDSYRFSLTKFDGWGRCIAGYGDIKETTLFIREANGLLNFIDIEDFYKFLENLTKQKRKDITHKQFEIFSTYAKVEAYKEKYFSDSMYSKTFNERLRKGEINQLNKDSFICNSSYINRINRFKTKDIK